MITRHSINDFNKKQNLSQKAKTKKPYPYTDDAPSSVKDDKRVQIIAPKSSDFYFGQYESSMVIT